MTDARLILHIGAGKTGSSAIQTFLRHNAAKLAEAGYVVPDRDLGVGGVTTGEHVWGLQELITTPNPRAVPEAFARLMAAVPATSRVIVSGENMSNPGNHRRFVGIAEVVPTRAILYVRRQDELLQSAWQQWHVKTEPDLNAWLIHALRRYGQWEKTINDWESVLGRDMVTVRIFERNAFHDGSLLNDFLHAAGLDDIKDRLTFDIGTVNPSLNDVVTSIVHGSKSLFADAHDNNYYNFVEKFAGNIFKGEKKLSLISRAQRVAILDHYGDMNSRVAARFAPDRPRLFAPIDHSHYDYPTQDDLVKRQIRFLNELVYEMHKYWSTNK